MSLSESDEEPERVEHVRAELSKKKSFFDYFQRHKAMVLNQMSQLLKNENCKGMIIIA